MSERVLAGAEPFGADGGPEGVLLVHGFTGSPASLRPFAAHYAALGLSVRLPRLPGHGTSPADLARRTWPEWVAEVDRALDELRARCARVVVVGQSFGAALAVHLAAGRPGDVHGLALLSPYLYDPRLLALPLLRHVRRAARGVGDDVARPGVTELAYPEIPVPALLQLAAFLRIARADLPRVRAPALVFRPGADHVIPRSNPRRVFRALGSARKELIDCPRSYHVISLDHDAEMVRDRVLQLFALLPGEPRTPGRG
ncbi:MAG: esterase [Actinomycetota bacterium]|nr:MAG: esterase [Actinomycetota bacterium]